MYTTLALTTTVTSLIQFAKGVAVQFDKADLMVLPNCKANGTNKVADWTVHQVKQTLQIKELHYLKRHGYF